MSKVCSKIKTHKTSLLFLLAVSFLFIIEYKFHNKIAHILKVEVAKQIKKQKVPLEFQKIDYSFFPPSIHMKDASFNGTGVIVNTQEIRLSLKLLPLVKAKIKPKHLSIINGTASVDLSSLLKREKSHTKSNAASIKLDEVFNLLPFDGIYLISTKLILLNNKDVLQLDQGNLSLIKNSNYINLDLSSEIKIRKEDLFKETFFLNTSVKFTPDYLYINFFNLQKENSIIKLSGQIDKAFVESAPKKKLQASYLFKNSKELRLNTSLNLSDFNNAYKHFLSPRLPHIKKQALSGQLQISGYFNKDLSRRSSNIVLSAKNISSPFAAFSSLQLKGEVNKSSLKTSLFEYKINDRSKLNFKGFELEKKRNSFFVSSQLQSKNLHIEDLLNSLNLKPGSINIPTSLDIQCGGLAMPNTQIKCKGLATAKKIIVGSVKNNGPNLIDVNFIETNFNGLITKKDFRFEVQATSKPTPEKEVSSGSASGVIDYVSGFDVDFEATRLNLDLVNSISGQKFKGDLSLTGSTQGSSRWGQFEVQLAGENFQFNEIKLKKAKANLNYKHPNLKLGLYDGNLLSKRSGIRGDVTLNASQNALSLKFDGEKANDTDIRYAFSDLFNLPEGVKFDANAFKFVTKGALVIDKADLDFSASLKNMNFFNERFKTAYVSINGKSGDWKVKEALFKKDKSSFNVTGKLNGFKEMDLNVTSNNLDLKDLTSLSQNSLSLTGPLKISLNASGPISGPRATGTAQLTSSLGPRKSNLGNSSFGFRIYENEIFIKGDAFNNRVIGEGTYPITEKGLISFNGQVSKLDILKFISLNTENAANLSTRLSLDANFRITPLTNQKFKWEGYVDNIMFKQFDGKNKTLGVSQISGKFFDAPITFEAVDKNLNKSKLSLDLSQKHQESLIFSGVLSLDFMKAYISTVENLNGEFVSPLFQLKHKNKAFFFDGGGFLKKGLFKTSAFPYVLSEINFDVEPAGKRIYFKQIFSNLNNSQIKGSGYIEPFPLNIDIDLFYDSLSLDYPDDISSTSNAKLKVSGSNLPLLVSGKLDISDGVFSMDTISSDSSEPVSPNKYLPNKILRKSTAPFNLDILLGLNKNFKLDSNEIKGFASGKLHFKGAPAEPLTKGTINLRPNSKIYFLDKIFNISEGRITYTNELLKNPSLFIDAHSIVQDNNDLLTKNYDVRMIISGTGASPDVNFTSSPPLSEKELISLITIGTVSTQTLGLEINSQQQAANSGLQFGSYLLQKNQALRDLQRRTGTQIGLSSSVDAASVNPKIEVKKSWSPRTSTTVSQTFGNQRNLSLKLEYKLNPKLSSVLGVQNNQTQDASQLTNRRVQEGEIFGLDLQYKFEFD